MEYSPIFQRIIVFPERVAGLVHEYVFQGRLAYRDRLDLIPEVFHQVVDQFVSLAVL